MLYPLEYLADFRPSRHPADTLWLCADCIDKDREALARCGRGLVFAEREAPTEQEIRDMDIAEREAPTEQEIRDMDIAEREARCFGQEDDVDSDGNTPGHEA